MPPSGSTTADDMPTPLTRSRLPVRRLVLLSVGAAALAFAGVVTMRVMTPAPKPLTGPVMTVSVVPVQTMKMADTLLVTGSLTPWEDLVIGSEASGLTIVKVLVDEGDWVKQGQLLAKLDDALLTAQLHQTEAQIAKSQAMLQIDDNDVKRAQELLKTSAISVQVAEQRQATAQSAHADLAVAEAQHAALLAQIAQTEIRAPTDGFISKRIARLGRVVAGGEELFREVRDGILELDAEIPDRLLGRCHAGQSVRIRGADGEEAVGIIRAVSPMVDTSSRNGIAHVRFPRSEGLRTGTFVSGELVLDQTDALAVPESAVLVKDGHPLVFVVTAKGTAALRHVETGERADGKVAIRSGVTAGDQVVTAGAGFLRDGDTVRVADK